MQGLCVSIKEGEVHLQIKEYKEFSSQIAFYSLESLIISRTIYEKITPELLT